jgi:hypothetical protein
MRFFGIVVAFLENGKVGAEDTSCPGAIVGDGSKAGSLSRKCERLSAKKLNASAFQLPCTCGSSRLFL